MHTAIVDQWGTNPKYSEADTPDEPAPGSGLVRIKVLAAGVHALVRLRVAGKHYSANTLPHIPGTDGVGTLASGQAVYFNALGSPSGGSFQEYVVVSEKQVQKLPDGVDPMQAAAFVNPASSSWMAIKTRTVNLPADFSVLILGATSASGKVAIDLTRQLGAKKVIGLARNATALASLGLDEFIVLQEDVTSTDFSPANNVDLILDYLYGPAAEALLQKFQPTRAVQYVQIGSLGGESINLTAAMLRSKNIAMRGSGPGSWTLDQFANELPGMLEAMKTIQMHKVNVIPLKDIEQRWTEKSSDRTVITP
jgi:NADPH:quinone reductase-like Zn-dependent oxidoreductase